MSDLSAKLQEARHAAAILWTPLGVFLGLLFCLYALKTLNYSEQNVVSQMRTLNEGESIVILAEDNQINTNYESKLIYVSGEATSDDVLRDILFDVDMVNIIKLRRVVEMYQWEEAQSTDEYGTSHYAYYRVWKSYLIESSTFQRQNIYQNPITMSFTGQTISAKQVRIGEFLLSAPFIETLQNFKAFPVITYSSIWQVEENIRHQFPNQEIHFFDNHYYIGKNPNKPQVGDLRIRFEIVPTQPLSIIAQQVNGYLVPYQTQTGNIIALLENASVSANKIFFNAKISLFIETLYDKFLSLWFMFLGLYALFSVWWIQKNPIPILGPPYQLKGWLASLIIAFSLIFSIIGMIWIDYSWLVGGTLLVIATLFWYLFKFARRKPQEESTLATETVVPEK
ncbi:membrane protein containing DUF1625 [Beggiatoa sp. PS]|nr:membrane protein containing DUF1625 [Beggiatoa sp. PS]